MNKGTELERLAHKFLWYQGFYVRTRTDIWIEEKDIKEAKITDVDILGFKLKDFLNVEKVLIDCKSDEKGFNQILRVSTLKNLFNINTTIILRESINKRIRYLANKLGHKIFSNATIIQAVKDKPNLGSFREEVYKKRFEIESNLKDLRKIKRELLFEISDIVLEPDPYKKFKLCYTIFNVGLEIIKDEKDSKTREIVLWLMYDIFMLSWLSIVLISSDLFDCPTQKRKPELENKFVEKWTSKNKVINMLKNIAGENYKEIEKDISFDPIPTYLATVLEISNYLINNKEFVDKILRINDYIIYEHILSKKDIDKNKIKEIFGIEESFFKIISTLNEKLIVSLSRKGEFPSEFFKII